jgi:hypothetical protein
MNDCRAAKVARRDSRAQLLGDDTPVKVSPRGRPRLMRSFVMNFNLAVEMRIALTG